VDLRSARSDLIAGGAGAVVLILAFFAFHLPIWLAIVVAVVIYAALRLLIPAPTELAPGVTRGDLNRIIHDGRGRVAQIQALGGQIHQTAVRTRVQRIASIAGDMYADFEQRPKDMGRIPDLGTTYLDPLINVLNRYVRLSSVESGGKQDETIGHVENDLLPKVETSFEGLYRQLMQDDVTDLDAASEGLKSLLDLGA
jgi:5-bromo-4-chloroindolyl phosphate hydrolysis protein